MQTPQARIFKHFRGFQRIFAVNLFLREIALHEPHAFAFDQINRRNYFDHIFKKFSSTEAPTAPDFSV
jgi:hypothetical protein